MASDKTPVTTTQPHTLSPRLRLLGVLLLLAILAGLVYWFQIANKPTASKEQTQAALTETAGKSDDEAIEKLTAAYNDAATDEGKAEAAFYLAGRYADKGDNQSALRYYRQADRLEDGNDIDVILGIANTAEAMENDKLAREYYQKAIDYYKPRVEGDPSLQGIVSKFETKIKDLE